LALSTATAAYICNPGDNAGEDLDIVDYFWWMMMATQMLTTCETDADCTAADSVCGTLSIAALDTLLCLDIGTMCATAIVDAEGVATGAYTDGMYSEAIYGSDSLWSSDCSGDVYDTAFFKANQEALQTGACDSSKADFDSETDECPDLFTCGTGTIDGDSILGCFPTPDCVLEAPTIPDSTVTYTLVCGATKIMATAAAAFAIAATI